jgi:hypothetical protein
MVENIFCVAGSFLQVSLADIKIQPLNYCVIFLKEADVIFTNDDWRVAIDFNISRYYDVIASIHTDLHMINKMKQELTPVSETKQIALLLQTIEAKLSAFNQNFTPFGSQARFNQSWRAGT